MTRNRSDLNGSGGHQNPYACVADELEFDGGLFTTSKAKAIIDFARVLKGRRVAGGYAPSDIEALARNLQNEMWRSREDVLGSMNSVSPVQILDPILALQSLGFRVEMHESLGQYLAGRSWYEVAGVIDKSKGTVDISGQFSPAIIKFTAAHELGHAVLHGSSGLHRDRAVDGAQRGFRDQQEREADKFASYFLLPGKLVLEAFASRFCASRFVLNDDTAFALDYESLAYAQGQYRNIRELARRLASAEQFSGRHFLSLADYFGVSVGAMSIRLEELGVVGFDSKGG